MPINFIDYSNPSPDRTFESFMEGARGRNELDKMPRDALTQELAQELTRSQIEKNKRTPAGGAGGAGGFGRLTGDVGNAYMISNALAGMSDNDPRKAPLTAALEQLQLNQQGAQSRIDTSAKINAARDYMGLTSDTKAKALGSFQALGVPELEARQLMNQGVSPQQYALSQGYSQEEIDRIMPQYALTSSSRTQQQSVEGAAAEESYLGDKIASSNKKYGRTFMGRSPLQIFDSLSSDPKRQDDAARHLAAQALGPEKALLQIRMAQGSTAHQAIKEVMNAGGSNIKGFGWAISPEIYEKAQGYMHEWLQGAVKARAKGTAGQRAAPPRSLQNQSRERDLGQDFSQALDSQSQSAPPGTVLVKAPNGKIVAVPQNRLESVLAAGGERYGE